MNHHSHRDTIITTGGGVITGGLVGGAVGAMLGGPVGLVLGLAAGSAMGAEAGEHIGEAIDMQGDIGYFANHYQEMPYYISEMEWEDYEPAYRFAIGQYDPAQPRLQGAREDALARQWPGDSDTSHLTWGQVRPVVEHVWSAYSRA